MNEHLSRRLRSRLKALGLGRLLHPFRRWITWACQRGFLPSKLRRVLPWSWGTEPFTIYGTGWKCKWFPTTFDIVGHRVFWSGLREWEKDTNPVILENIRHSRCFLDIGANCGMYTVLGCMVNPSVKAVAVEPVPKTFAALTNNITQNGLDSRVTALNCALGTSNGTVPFHEAEEATESSLAVDGYRGQHGNVIQVNCRTLDSIVTELNLKPDFMKVDVEGFAYLVLLGATRTLSEFRPRIVLEANLGDPAQAVTEILSRFGYRFQNITGGGLQMRSEIVPVPVYSNWLCLPSS